MHSETDISVLEPFLSLERLEWADIIRFHDEVLGMAGAPNALDSFRHLLRDLEHSPGKPLVFRGSSRCFSRERCNALLGAFGDLQKRHPDRGLHPSPLAGFTMAREENAFGGLIRWLRSVKRPTIMVFQGDVSLSFLGVGLACDHRIATSDTVFYNQGRDHNMPPGAGLLYLLPAYIGLGRANTLVTRTAELSSQSALTLGLLDELVTASELDRMIQTMVTEISCFSPDTLGTIKQLLNNDLPDFDAYFTLETQGLDKALRGKPWERLPHRGTEDASLQTETTEDPHPDTGSHPRD